MWLFLLIGGYGIIWMLVLLCLLYWGGDLWSLGLEVFELKIVCLCIEVKGDIELWIGSDFLWIGEVFGEIDIGFGLVLYFFKLLWLFRMFFFVCRILLCLKFWLIRLYGFEVVFCKLYWKKEVKSGFFIS